MAMQLDEKALDQMFYAARTHSYWSQEGVSDGLLRRLYALTKMGPTSANCQPARIVFVASPEAKARLKPCLIPSNVEKTMSAPVTAIVGYDTEFYEKLPRLYPHADARTWFVGKSELIASTAFRNSSLQGAYLILAARALGLDCGPMSGFDNAKVDQEFFSDGKTKSNLLVNLGHGASAKLHPRNPRLDFDEACRII